MAELLLGIDVGTYSTKGVLTTLQGGVVKEHVIEHAMSVPQPGWAEHDPEAVWWQGVTATCRALLSDGYTGRNVAGVAVSAIGPCLLPLNAAGRPLRPGILYGVDTRASEQVKALNNAIGEAALLAHSGMIFTSQAIGPKISWLKKNEPHVWRETAHLTTASSFLVYRLTGEHVIDRHTASHFMPLIDINTLEWSPKYEHLIAPLTMLPRLGWSSDQAGEVTAAAANATGLIEGTPVAVGAVDALSEALSVGVERASDLMIMYGSTTFFILVLDEPVRDPRVWLTAGAFPGQYVLAAGMATTGSLTRWFRDQLAADLPPEVSYARLFEAAARIAPGSEGLVTLPYFSGERTPLNDPNARGVIAGLNLTHTRDHLFRSVLEGTAYGIRNNIETFEEFGASVGTITGVGGGTKSDVWPQIVSDVTGKTQLLPARTIGASLGDAFLAGLASDKLQRDDLKDWVGAKRPLRPDPSLRAIYDDYYLDFHSLYRSSAPTVHRLATRGNRREESETRT